MLNCYILLHDLYLLVLATTVLLLVRGNLMDRDNASVLLLILLHNYFSHSPHFSIYSNVILLPYNSPPKQEPGSIITTPHFLLYQMCVAIIICHNLFCIILYKINSHNETYTRNTASYMHFSSNNIQVTHTVRRLSITTS